MAEFAASGAGAEAVSPEGMIQELQHFCDELWTIKTGLSTTRIPAPWLCGNVLPNAIKCLKQAAKQANDGCTKIGVIGVEALKGDVKQSLLDELMGDVRQTMSILMSIIQGAEFCAPLMEYICVNLRAELHLIKEVLVLVEKEDGASLSSAIGMVWKANDRLQKIPITNKAAYRRLVLETLNVMEDTAREFREYMEASEVENSTKTEDEDDMDTEDFALESMGTYSAEERPIVESALELMAKQRAGIKASLSAVNEVAERVSAHPEHGDTKMLCFQWACDVILAAKKIESVCVDLGAELYSPIDEDSVGEQKECNISVLVALGQRVLNPGFDVFAVLGEGPWADQYNKDIDTVQKSIEF